VSRKSKNTNGDQKAEVEQEVWAEIEFYCPVRGKVKQLVKGTRYKSPNFKPATYTADQFIDTDSQTEDPIGE